MRLHECSSAWYVLAYWYLTKWPVRQSTVTSLHQCIISKASYSTFLTMSHNYCFPSYEPATCCYWCCPQSHNQDRATFWPPSPPPHSPLGPAPARHQQQHCLLSRLSRYRHRLPWSAESVAWHISPAEGNESIVMALKRGKWMAMPQNLVKSLGLVIISRYPWYIFIKLILYIQAHQLLREARLYDYR